MLLFIYFLLIFLTFIYVYKIIFFYRGLFRIHSGKNKQQYRVTVLIPARNEAKNITACLDALVRQNYPKNKLQIIVIDDDSTDNTADQARSFFEKYPFIQLISLDPCPPGVSPKKRALQAGIEQADGKIILTTDADCQAPPKWIKKMISYFEEDVGMVAGYVGFEKNREGSLFSKIQALEFLGITSAGLGSINMGDPIIANGANLGFRRTTFFEAGGYEGNNHISSGDDDLLMQNIDKKTAWKIRAAFDPDTFIQTEPIDNIGDFINQRIRWASKGIIYKKLSLVLFLLSVYCFYLLLFVSLPFAVSFFKHFPYPLFALAIKMAADYVLIFKATKMLNRTDLRKYFLLTEILQIPYIIYVGFAGIMGAFSWKDR